MTLTARIRAFLASGDNAAAHTPVNEALHDVLDKCERMRDDHRDNARGIAAEFEQTIADALAIAIGA